MDLSMSADFDSTLLDWDDDAPSKDSHGLGNGSTSAPNASTGGDDEQGQKPSLPSTQARKESFSRLPSFPTSIGGFSSSSDQPASFLNTADGTNGEAGATMTGVNMTNPFAMQMLYPLTGSSQDASSTGAVDGTASLQQQQQNLMVQYALTGQSAGAPFPNVSFSNNKKQMDTVSSLSTTTGNVSSATSTRPQAKPAAATGVASAPTPTAQLPTPQLHPLGIQSSAVCPPLSATSAPASAPNAMQFANPYMFNPYALMASNPQLFAAFQSSQQQMAAHYAAAQATAAQMTAGQAAAAAAARANPLAPTLPPPRPKKSPRKPKANSAKSKKESGDKKNDAPPFLLFDAPCELRQNFMQSQRMLNLPVHQDGNSYHYGMAVNGFHPQLNVATDPISPLSRDQPALPSGVKLLDSRHKKKNGTGKERNEREQKRAQKITELIEQIRVSMEDGGWKVEMKSKYHTLSMCADYVKHLIKSTEEKEEAVEKAKSDLEVKERKLEEDKALLEGRSDPESVMSSLTASTARSAKGGDEAAANGANQVSETSSGSKRKAEEQLPRDSGSDANLKKVKAEESSADSSGADDGGSGNGSGPQGHNISIGKMSSSVSELTDSNRGSSDSGGEKRGSHNGAAHKKHPQSEDESSDLPSSSSISSTAAVLRGAGSHHREHGHADVVIKEKRHSRHRKRQREERSSLDRKFVIDYEEVFLTSNVPQIIATPAGRIVAWNKFFLKATGLHNDAVQRLTIFSLVQPDKLANLFEMVAEALRQKPASVSESSSANSSSCQTTSESSALSNDTEAAAETRPQPTEYSAMTLPCTPLVSAPSVSSESSEDAKQNPLYMTVTLMPDQDIRKRCFHCVFTDEKGTDGKMGFITPALLAKLFAEPDEASQKIRLPPPPAPKKSKVDEKVAIKEEGIEEDADGEGDSD